MAPGRQGGKRGAADRKPILFKNSWNDKYVLSGMYAGGKNYWRITPDTTGGMTLDQFKVAGAKDPTFSIAGQTITFPGGKIIEDAKIAEIGTCGYWVETATDVMPVITYIENRYEEYPAFMETFESYEAAAFEATTANPLGCWEVKKNKDSSANIVADGANKAMALKGTYSLKLKDILANVTAGDTYAENQVWQIDVNVPANMGADAEIVLLDIYGSKTKSEAGGFKISGGKIYYDKAGEYVEMEGVDVSKGGKLTLKRTLDFNIAEAFTSDYAVYDAEGKLLAVVENVAMKTIKLPVQKISLSVTNVTEAVNLDNLKLYATGLAADFELYNAKTGIQYTDLETAKDSNTAYRLSWMNGTAYEKVYSIVAEYSDGTTKVIEEIKMAPGSDAVATGIVEVAEGQTVKLYARNDSQPEPEGGKPTVNQPGASKGDMTLLIIIISAVVLLALIVAIIVVMKKPAKKEEPKEEKEEPEA